MMKKGQANFMVVILMVVIIAMIAISVIWGTIRAQQDTTAVTNDPFTAINLTCVRITDNCYLAGTLITKNATGNTITTGNFSECGEGSLRYGALVNIQNDTDVLPAQNASYTESACGRITGLTGTIIDYVPLLMAVVILVFVSAFAIKQ